MNPELEHEQEIEALWMEDQESMRDLVAKGAQSYFDNLPEQEFLAEENAELPCACIDERVGGHKLAIPGSGIMESPDDAYKLLKESGVSSMSSHQDCGAAKLAFDRLGDPEKEIYGSADAYAQSWAKNMADRLGVPYIGHHSVKTPGRHVARTIYYDASGRFIADAPGVPKGFTISRKFESPEKAQANLNLAIKIATGDHGFKGKYSSENPLVIVPVGDTQDLSALRAEISQVVERDPELNGMIKIDEGYHTEAEVEEEIAA
jgi:hypothetical protein